MPYDGALVTVINDVLAHGFAHNTSTDPTHTRGLGTHRSNYTVRAEESMHRNVSKPKSSSS